MESLGNVDLSEIKSEYCQENLEENANEVPVHLLQYLPFRLNGSKLQSICRICLNSIDNNKVSLLSVHNGKTLCTMLKEVTSFPNCEMYTKDNLPLHLCETCQCDVIYCYQFKCKCEKSEAILKSLLNEQVIFMERAADIDNELEPDLKKENVKDEVKEESGLEDIEEEYLEDLNDLSDSELCIIQNGDGICSDKLEITVTDTKNLLDEDKSLSSQSKRPTVKQYSCNFCFKKFEKLKILKAHIFKKHRTKDYSHTCDQCAEVFCSQHDLDVHSAVHTKGPVWTCNKCQKAFKARFQLRRHIQRHMEAKRFSCESCGKAFSELYALRRHVRVHTGEMLEKKYACSLCDKRYSERNQLRTHEARHRGERRCVCAACGKAFASARLLASHRLVHSDHKPYACNYCDKQFRHESTRNTHHRTHTGEKPYVCATCGKTFIQNSNLTLHMRTHTGEKPYPCSKCDKKFATGSSLKNHLWLHTGEKPFGCTVCGKRFARQDLSLHMRQHTGERPHACSACAKRFVSAARLRDHTRIHTGEKPFECASCPQKFSTKSHLVKHLKKHQVKKKRDKRDLVVLQKVDYVGPVFLGDGYVVSDSENRQSAEGNIDGSDPVEEAKKNVTLELAPEVPIEVTGELVVQDDCDVKEILVVDSSQNDANYQSGNICINADGVNYVNTDVNLVTVNEGATVKLYQLDQSLVQIHSSGGQVTISKITSKMTANF